MTYLDTSALIKRFVVEKGSTLVQTIVAQEVAPFILPPPSASRTLSVKS